MINDAERVPKLAVESLDSNFGSVPYQILNFIKVVEPCIACKVGLTICPSYLTVTVKFKRDHVHVRVLKKKQNALKLESGSPTHVEKEK